MRGYRRIPELTKRPDESYPIGLKYISPDLEKGESIVSAVITVTPSEVGGLATTGGIVLDGDKVSQTIYGGIDGHEYYVKFLAVTSGGHTYEDSIFVKVRLLS